MAVVTVLQSEGWSKVITEIGAGNSVNLEAGVFTSTTAFSPLTMKPYQFLRGAGVGITIIDFAGSGDAIATSTNGGLFAYNVAIGGFTLDGAQSHPDFINNGIVINGAWESVFEDLQIINFAKGIGFSLLGKPGMSAYRNILKSITCGTGGKPNRIGIRIASPDFGESGDPGLAYTNINTLINCNGNFNSQIGLSALGTGALQLIECDFESNGDWTNVGTGTIGIGVLLNSCVNTLINGGGFENNPRPQQRPTMTGTNGDPFTIQIDPSNAAKYGFQDDDVVFFSPVGNTPVGFLRSAPYFVVQSTIVGLINQFKLSLTIDGTPILTTTATSGIQMERNAKRSVICSTLTGTSGGFVKPVGSAGFQKGDIVRLSDEGEIPDNFDDDEYYFVVAVVGDTFTLGSPPGTPATVIHPGSVVDAAIVERAGIISIAATVNTSGPNYFAGTSTILLQNGDIVFLTANVATASSSTTKLQASVPYYVKDLPADGVTFTFNLAASPGPSAATIVPAATASLIVQRPSAGAYGDIELTGASSRTTVIRARLGSERGLYGPSVGSSGDTFLTAENSNAPMAEQFTGNWLQKARIENASLSTTVFEGRVPGTYRIAFFGVRGEANTRLRIFNTGEIEWTDGASPPNISSLKPSFSFRKTLLFNGVALDSADWAHRKYLWRTSDVSGGTGLGIGWITSGTFINPTITFTNKHTATFRNQWSFPTTMPDQVIGVQTTKAIFFRGNAAGLGGWFFVARFGVDTLWNGTRIFVGMSVDTNVVGLGDPSTVNNTVGFAVEKIDNNGTIHFVTRGTTTATKFYTTLNMVSNQGFEAYIYCAPNGSQVEWRLLNVSTGQSATGLATLTLPADTVLLRAGVLASNAAVAKLDAVQLCGTVISVETEN